MRKLVAILVALGAVAGVGALWAIRGSGSDRDKEIVFQAKVNAAYQLFTIDPAGGNLRQITDIHVRRSSIPGVEKPAWSPDGKRIIFDTDYQGTRQDRINLFTIRPDGSGLAMVPLAIGMFSGSPAYSSDGKMISFDWDAAASGPHQLGIDVANSDGSEVRRLTSVDLPNVLQGRSDWSPDGKWIVFTENHGLGPQGEATIVKLELDGSGRKELTPWELNASNAKWSPDGSLIAFNSYNPAPEGRSSNLFAVRPDGTGLRQLTHYSGGKLNAFMGDWSPDGTRIVFHLRGPDPDAPGTNQLFVMNVDGAGSPRQLTRLPPGSNPGYPSWSPAV